MKNVLVLLADWANGIFSVIAAAYIFEMQYVWWHIIIGILIAMSPDLDAIPELFKRGKVSASRNHPSDHRDLLHIPIVFLLLGVGLWYIFGYWGAVFLFATMLHFINDLYGTGWGVPIFSPFTKTRYKLFTNNRNEFSLKNFIRKIEYKNLNENIVQYGYDDWIEDVYFKLTPISILEYLLFAFACVLLFLTL